MTNAGRTPDETGGRRRRVSFDVPLFFSHLDVARRMKRLSWRELAAEADVHPSLLSRMAQGQRPDIDNLCRLIDWAHLDLSTYIVREAS